MNEFAKAEFFEVKIDADTTFLGQYVSIDVVKTAGGAPIEDFSFKIVYDTLGFQLTGVTPGIMFTDVINYAWEDFQWNVSQGVITATGDANIDDGNLPVTLAVPDGTALFTLNFIVTNSRDYDCTDNPLRFYWEDCLDNTITWTQFANNSAVSKNVYNFAGGGSYVDVTDSSLDLPTYYGAPTACSTSFVYTYDRNMDLYNGNINILCSDSIDQRGDINLDGFAFGDDDYLLMIDAAIISDSVLDNIPDIQLGNSDIDGDGEPLTINDFVYMYRVLIDEIAPPDSAPDGGLNLPRDKSSPAETIVFSHLLETGIVASEAVDPFSGAFLTFNGDVVPDVVNGNTEVFYHFNGYQTKVLLMPNLSTSTPTPEIEGGDILYIAGNGLLSGASAATDGMTAVDAEPGIAVPPEPVIDPDGMPNLLIAPMTAETSFKLYLGNPEGCTECMDVSMIDPSSLMVNNSIMVRTTEMIDSRPGFSGSVLKMLVPADEFITSYAFPPEPVHPPEPGVPPEPIVPTYYPFAIYLDGMLVTGAQLSVATTIDLAFVPCGDCNGDFGANIGDAVYLVNFVFKGGTMPVNNSAADANGDMMVNIGDGVYLINYVFKGGPAPACGCVESCQ